MTKSEWIAAAKLLIHDMAKMGEYPYMVDHLAEEARILYTTVMEIEAREKDNYTTVRDHIISSVTE